MAYYNFKWRHIRLKPARDDSPFRAEAWHCKPKRITTGRYAQTFQNELQGSAPCTYSRLVVSHLENKLKPKKLKQNQNSSKKLPKNSKKSSKNSIYRKFHIRYSGQNCPNGMKGQFSTHFFPQTQGFS